MTAKKKFSKGFWYESAFEIIVIIVAIISGQIGRVEKGTSIMVIFVSLIFIVWNLYSNFKK